MAASVIWSAKRQSEASGTNIKPRTYQKARLCQRIQAVKNAILTAVLATKNSTAKLVVGWLRGETLARGAWHRAVLGAVVSCASVR